MTVGVFSPLEGTFYSLDRVQDPIFASEKVGPGAAIMPASLEKQEILCPVEGTIARVMAHGAVVVTRTGVPVLVHLGINTVTLNGAGFTQIRQQGDPVKAGDPLLIWHPQVAVDAGLDPIVPVIILDSADLGVSPVVTDNTPVTTRDMILEVDLHPLNA